MDHVRNIYLPLNPTKLYSIFFFLAEKLPRQNFLRRRLGMGSIYLPRFCANSTSLWVLGHCGFWVTVGYASQWVMRHCGFCFTVVSTSPCRLQDYCLPCVSVFATLVLTPHRVATLSCPWAWSTSRLGWPAPSGILYHRGIDHGHPRLLCLQKMTYRSHHRHTHCSEGRPCSIYIYWQ